MIAPRLLRGVTLLAVGSLGACTFMRAAYWNTPQLDAPGYFDNRLAPAPAPAPLQHRTPEAVFDLRTSRNTTYASFDALLEANQTRAFVVVRDDTIVYERYFGAVNETTLLPSFSLCKTIAATLVGAACADGLIPSMHEPATTFLPELANRPHYRDVTLDHLLRMTSGIDFEEESYDSVSLYYCTDLRKQVFAYDVGTPPGYTYRYGSINIQLLWEVLHRRLAGRTLTDYFVERIWRPLGAERAASWSLDSADSGIEKFFGGFNATARDYARLGLLHLHQGCWRGQTIVPPEWVAESLQPDPVAGIQTTTDGAVRRGRYQWFLTLDGSCFFAKGYLGQYVFVAPEQHVVIVRFGNGYGDVDWLSLLTQISRCRT